jgi:hypothetical protein
MNGPFLLCPSTGRVLIQPSPDKPPVALQDYARDQYHHHQQGGSTGEALPSPLSVDAETLAALCAAGSCSRTF